MRAQLDLPGGARLLPGCPCCGAALEWWAVTVDDGERDRPGWHYTTCPRCGLYLERDDDGDHGSDDQRDGADLLP